MKIKSPILITAILALALIGCASFNANVFNSEKLAKDAAVGATHEFNLYYSTATNGASPAELTRLNEQRETLYAVDRQMSRSLLALDDARLAYKANSADTNKTAALAALQTVTGQSSNIVALVQSFLKPQTK